ncbi:hypothetical protein CRG98_039913 [Punica granatum]|uniref:Uncharacterized protein n=1 Tax=Punica granatum TaxID=22663 RepID=A0A2I0I7Q7_PUNGR|nr:hypothetical protein CRG98_039913 [Punica granatum]
MLPYALLAYRTSIRTSTGAIPYSLVYGMEAVLPIEVEIPSMRILAEAELKEAEWAKQRYEQLNFIDEKRLKALCHGQCYQQRMARAFNTRVRHHEFNPGDLVLRKVLHVTPDSRGKFSSKTSLRRSRQKLGNERHGLKSCKGEPWQKESINHFLARSKTLRGRPKQKLEEPRGAISPKAQVQSGTLRGIFSPTDARLAHVASTTKARTTADSDFRPLGIRRRSTLELEYLIARPGHPQRSSRLSARPVLDKSKTSGLRKTPSSNKHLGRTTIREP